MTCPKYEEARNKVFKDISDIFPHFNSEEEQARFEFIMRCEDSELSNILVNFLKHITKDRGVL